MSDDKKIIFSMVGVSKAFSPQKKVLNNIYLSFFYGAKIGIIGLNGAGKSTLLKIIAGVEKNYQGNVVFSPGYSVGYLEQDPKLDPEKTVKQCVQEGVQPIMDMLAEPQGIPFCFSEGVQYVYPFRLLPQESPRRAERPLAARAAGRADRQLADAADAGFLRLYR